MHKQVGREMTDRLPLSSTLPFPSPTLHLSMLMSIYTHSAHSLHTSRYMLVKTKDIYDHCQSSDLDLHSRSKVCLRLDDFS